MWSSPFSSLRSEEQLTAQELLISQPDAPRQGIGIDVSEPGPPTQNYGTVISGQYVAWMTSTSTRIDSWPWTLKVHDLRTGDTTQLTRSPKLDGRDPSDVPGSTGPAIVGDHVAWAEVHGTPRQQRVDVMECQIARIADRVIVARDSGLPAATEGALYFAQPYEFGFPKPQDAFTIQRVDVKTGRQTTVATLGRDRNALPTGLAVSDTAVAWTHRQGKPRCDHHPGHRHWHSRSPSSPGPTGSFGLPRRHRPVRGLGRGERNFPRSGGGLPVRPTSRAVVRSGRHFRLVLDLSER